MVWRAVFCWKSFTIVRLSVVIGFLGDGIFAMSNTRDGVDGDNVFLIVKLMTKIRNGLKGPVASVVDAIGGLVDRLTLPAREKRELELEITQLLASLETVSVKNRAEVVRGEAGGNWLQRSWRPLLMLVFATIILIGAFTPLPMLEDTSRFWDLLEIGLGGYIIGKFKSK